MANTTKTINELQMDLQVVMKNLKEKVTNCISKYSGDAGDLPTLPSFQALNSSTKLYYEYSQECIRIGDEVTQVIISISLVLSYLTDIKSTGISKDATNNYSLLNNFRNYIDDSKASLKDLKFDMFELKKQINNRLRLLQDISFQK